MANITNFLKAGQPCLSIDTVEVERAIKATRIDCKAWSKFTWDCQRGIIELATGEVVADITDPIEMMGWLSGKENAVLFAINMNQTFQQLDSVQELINEVSTWKASQCCLVIVGTNIKLPSEIESFFLAVDFDKPALDDLKAIAQDLIKEVKQENDIDVPMNMKAVEAARGLTEFEAETAFALSIITNKTLDPEIIIEQKKQLIKRSGFMEFHPPVDISEVGGLNLFKDHLHNRKKAFEPGSKLPKPRAFLLVGIPGTGKSLVSKAAANILGWPLIRFDVAACKGNLVGDNEKNMRQATKTFDAFHQAVIWADEIEKAFAGVQSSGMTDGGSTAAMFGTFLTWMQETTSECVIFATANDISNLPPEFVRRFTRFFVDLPSNTERAEIIDIMNRRYESAIPKSMAKNLKGWTGAEIEQLAIDSLFDGVPEAMDNIVPISQTMREKIESIREWAKTRARRANEADTSRKLKTTRRKLS